MSLQSSTAPPPAPHTAATEPPPTGPPDSPRRWPATNDPERLALLAGAGGVLAVVLLFGFFMPFNIRNVPGVVTTFQPAATILGAGWAGAFRFGLAIVLAFAAFGVTVLLAKDLRGRAAVALVLAGTVLFSLILLRANPVGAHDVYHNVADARTLWLYGENPTSTPPSAHPEDAFTKHVPAWQDYPSIYGPLWYVLAGAPLPFAGDQLWANVIGQKLLTAAFLLALTALVISTAERLRPGSGVAAGVLTGWNPLMQWETAGNAHNDIVMVFFAVACLWAVTHRRWTLVFPLLALSVATKFVLVLLGPVLLAWLLARRDVPRRAVFRSLGLGVALTALLFAPFLLGGDALKSFQEDTNRVTGSTGAATVALLLSMFAITVDRATSVMKLILGGGFLIGYGLLLAALVRRPTEQRLAATCAWVAFLFLLLARWWFWSWYVLWLVPFAALLPGTRVARAATLFAAAAMLAIVPYNWLVFSDWNRLQLASAATAFVLPALAALLPLPSDSSTEGEEEARAVRRERVVVRRST